MPLNADAADFQTLIYADFFYPCLSALRSIRVIRVLFLLKY